MTLREGGILVARGLAMVFLARGLASGVQAVEYLPGFWGNRGWQTPIGFISQAALAGLFAGFLWRGASGFTSDLPESSNGPSIDQVGLLRALIAAIAAYWFFVYVDKLVTLATTYFGGSWEASYMAGLYRDLIMLVFAVWAFIWASKGLQGVRRVLSYPRGKP